MASLGRLTPLEQNDHVCLQWPTNVLTKQPDSIRLCKKVWISCLSPLLTTPVYDAVEACNYFDEESTIATLDDALLADCGNLIRVKATQLVREILTTSDAQWSSCKYIRIVHEIAQLQAAADTHLALDMARMGLSALGTGLCLRGKDARQCVLDRVRGRVNNNANTGQPQEAPAPVTVPTDDSSNSSNTPRTCNGNNISNSNSNVKDDKPVVTNEKDFKKQFSGELPISPSYEHLNWSFSTTTVKGNMASQRVQRAPSVSKVLRNLQRHRITHIEKAAASAKDDSDTASTATTNSSDHPKVKYEFAAPRELNSKKSLTGSQIEAQTRAWCSYGCLEPSVVDSVSQIAELEDATPLVDRNKKVFVLLGATSELGPFSVLAKLGATIAIVARPGYLSKIQKLVYDAKFKTNATLLLPVRPRNAVTTVDDEYLTTNYMDFNSNINPILEDDEDINDDLGDCIDRAGADIINDTPELAEWIVNLCPEKQLVLVNLANLDGEDHVLVSTGMDLICEAVCQQRRDTCLAYYVSPTTAHCVSEGASMDSERRVHEAPLWQKILTVTNLQFEPQGSWPKLPNTGLRVCNGLARYQGHYYALAKTSQMWRCMLARSEGHLVSANLGPSSRTDSMISYKFISLALEGMQIVPPLVTFDVEPAKTLMAALMLWDLNHDASSANPANHLEHPMCLFLENAVHGGTWRCPYTVDSMGRVSYIVGHFREAGKSPLGSLSNAVVQLLGNDGNGSDLDEDDNASVKSSYSRGSRGRRLCAPHHQRASRK
uniref:Uncharacterized protein n=1 Tax=Leptocylindrus danicus TaxID=163516 RepID=A0A7S2L865_9STRA|mmetsp:Transcript_32726/g.47351  ORF Transcript_32726/g.47351 Transcript_32726/m.47351 type:complete len:773 (+) Transcript_32726:235-2553(+)|eukprot:CAMPEP_0116034926 /NCGR_PEP_ID=MMETSP0321-20121206/19988_1 /TAXON_ID=163516 /ORGANISM="Leptocylindrus danicus var. danicus, Strain B650" /LENGTH=772 /DNA_ID=CAMNT_0003511511 /DNA_START=107 /DNA_END=2425 /DNA_ORIENTATION=-